MGLTSGSLIALLSIVTIGLNAGTVWLWPRAAGRRLSRNLTRSVLLTATQISLALTVLVAVNSYYLFFTDWNELIGIGGAGAGQAAGIPKPKTKQANVHAEGPALPPISGAGNVTSSKNPQVNGAIQLITIHGITTGLDNKAYVMLPPQYFQPQYASRRFPTVVMMTGYPGNPKSLLTVMRFPDMVRQAQNDGTAQPMIYILMRPTVAPPRDTECTDVPGGPQTETFFANDVPRAIEATYRAARTADGWAIMGDSTGGYCAAKVAMRHSDRFSAAVSLSGYFHSLKDLTTGDLYDKSPTLRAENDLLWRAQHLPQPPISILVTSCLVGEKTYPQAKAFLALAKAPMKVDSLMLDSGGHNYRTFQRMLPGALQWLSQHLHVDAIG